MALQQVEDLRAEGDSLHQFLKTLEDRHWEMQTPFKDRTVNWVVQHLHDADRWTVHSVTDPDGFRAWMKDRSLVKDPEVLQGKELLQSWRDYFQDLCDALEAAPHAKWKPGLTARMSTTCFTSLAQIPTEFRTYAISASARSAGLSSIENSRYQTPSHTYDSSLLQGRSGNGTNHPNTTTSKERPLNSRTSSRREGTSRKRT